MSKPNLSNFTKKVKGTIVKHSPEILTGIGIAGMITTTVLAVKATPRALRLIEEEKDATGQEKLPVKDTIKVTWKCYIPAALTCAASTACLIGASTVSSKRNAILATAYKLSETAFTEYREKVVETIGEKKEKEVREKIHEDRVHNHDSSASEIVITEVGNTLCHDYYSGRYFKSDMDKIKKAINNINHQLLIDGYVGLNDFYSEIGLDPTSQSCRYGWNMEMLNRHTLIELDTDAILTKDGVPCIVIDFKVPPKLDFDKFF